MKIGILGGNVGDEATAERIVALAEKTEAVGGDSFWTYEHAMIPLSYESRYPYHASGKLWGAPESNWVDPLVVLAHIAARTKRIGLGTGINILPQVNPLLFAKQTASIDSLSNGRLVLGLGVGWLEEEFVAMGVPFEKRGKRMDDYLTAIRKVWSGEVVEHQSEFLNWSGFRSYPLPAQRPGPKLVIGGVTPPAIRRVAAHGDGWFAVGSVKMLRDGLNLLRSELEKNGRRMEDIELTSTWFINKQSPDAWKEFEDQGFSRLLVPVTTLEGRDWVEGLEILGDRVLSKL